MGTAAIGGLIKSSVDLEARFGKTMSLVAASTGAPKSAIAGLRAEAMKLGASTKFSANEAADAMLELGKAGISTSDIMGGALSGTLLLAAAGDTDLATATTIASNAMNTFNLRGKDMNIIAAALAGGANASSASVSSLGEALSQVGPGATNAGLSLQDTVGVLSAFDAAGIKGSDAGTSLKTMLANLVPQTKKSASAMAALGLEFTDSQGKFLPITNVAGQLQKALGGLSEAQRTTALTTLFGSDASRAATVLMKEGAGGIAKYIKATKDQGAAQKLADANMSGTAGALERMHGAIETAQLALGTALAPTVVKVANYLSTTLIPALTKIPAIFAQVKAYIAPAILVFQSFFQSLTSGSGQSNARFEQFRATVMSVFVSVQSIITSAVSIISSLWNRFGATILNFANNTLKNLMNQVQGVFTIIQGIFQVFAALLKGDWKGVWDGIKKILSGAVTVVKAQISQMWNVIKTLFSAGKIAIVAIFRAAFEGLKAGAMAGWDAAKSYVKSLPGKITAAIGDLAAIGLHAGAELLSGLARGLADATGLSKIAGAAKKVANKVKGFFPGSPVKEGPLVSWNNGGAGKRLMGMVAVGIASGSAGAAKAAGGAAGQIARGLVAGLQSGGLDAYLADVKKKITDSFATKRADLKRVTPGMSKKEREAVYAFNARQRKDAVAYNDAARKAIKTQKAAVDQLAKSLAGLKKKVDAARSDLQSLKDARASLADQTASSISGELDLTQTNGKKMSFATVAANVSGLAARAKAFAGKLRALLATGIPAGLVQEVASLGTVAGIGVADALLSGSKQQIGQLAADYAGVDAYSKQIGDVVAGGMYDAGIRAQEGILKGLLDDKAIQKSADQLAKKLTKAVKKALGIKSPSRVFQNEVGKYLPAGIVAGIDDGQRALDRRVAGMVSVAKIGSITPGDFAGGVAASSQVAPQFNVYPQPGQTEEQIGRAAANRLMWAMS